MLYGVEQWFVYLNVKGESRVPCEPLESLKVKD